jgi:hypothetical protein
MCRVSLCGIAPGAPIGGCDPPQPASIATATPQKNALWLKRECVMAMLPFDGPNCFSLS